MIEHLILVRHLKKDSPREGAFYGSTDLPIIPTSVNPVDIDGNELYCSPMTRCTQTAKLYFPDSKIIEKDDARECDFGDWEGMTFAEIADAYPSKVEQWKKGTGFQFPNGEKLKGFSDRVEALSKDLIQKDEKTVILVTHAGVIRFILCYFLGIDYKKSMSFNVDPGSFSCIKIFDNGMGVVHKLNSIGDQTWLKSL
ncbi:MAG: histidine phosphatase family protein [Lentisphaeraceae bacterium]|nr:histidine phosphatase family protein [Lentisphaeraceae bacterium]